MAKIDLNLSDDLISLLGEAGSAVESTAKELIVLGLYHRGILSSGKGADLLNMARIDFIQYASSLGIPYFNLTADELQTELDVLDKQWQRSSSPTPVP